MAEKEKDDPSKAPPASDKPWKRAGTPRLNRKSREHESPWNTGDERVEVNDALRPTEPIGKYTDELLVDQGARWHADRPPLGPLRERCALELWDHWNNAPAREPTLYCLLAGMFKDHPEWDTPEHQRLVEIVAATLIRWTQTNVGSGFLDEVSKLVEAEVKRLQPAVKKHKTFLASVGEITLMRHETEEI